MDNKRKIGILLVVIFILLVFQQMAFADNMNDLTEEMQKSITDSSGSNSVSKVIDKLKSTGNDFLVIMATIGTFVFIAALMIGAMKLATAFENAQKSSGAISGISKVIVAIIIAASAVTIVYLGINMAF